MDINYKFKNLIEIYVPIILGICFVLYTIVQNNYLWEVSFTILLITLDIISAFILWFSAYKKHLTRYPRLLISSFIIIILGMIIFKSMKCNEGMCGVMYLEPTILFIFPVGVINIIYFFVGSISNYESRKNKFKK